MELAIFLLKAVGISLSGVMAPGAVTAATIAQGTSRPNSGALIAIGHGFIEIPLIFLIMYGLGTMLQETEWLRIAIGLAGGGFLIWMAVQMLRQLRHADFSPEKAYPAGPIATGVILSISNPYFLLWWATVGLNLTNDARQFGMIAFAMFAAIHWLCDLVWLSILSIASFKGSHFMSSKNQRIILAICAVAIAFFGIIFIWDAIGLCATLKDPFLG